MTLTASTKEQTPVAAEPDAVTPDAEPKGRPQLPPELSMPEALGLLNKAHEKGWLDENFLPKVSRAKAAILANTIAKEVNLSKHWTVFGKFWNMKAMAAAYQRGMGQRTIDKYINELENILKI